MQRATVLVEQRKHPRAHLQLPARIRWQGPLGMRLEITQTIDVSREGVLLYRDEDSLVLQSRVWVTFPFDAEADLAAQSEIPARIVRVDAEPGGGYRVALRLQTVRRRPRALGEPERRRSARVPFCMPIFVRPEGTPWPEESMTSDFSRFGLRFETSHVYSVGETVLARLPWGEWANAGELVGRVTRVEPVEPQPILAAGRITSAVFSGVAVQWIHREKTSGFAVKTRAT